MPICLSEAFSWYHHFGPAVIIIPMNANNRLRVISLLPAGTEMVCSLGFGKHLIGRSHECDFPDYVQAAVVCTETKLNGSGSSLEINQQVHSFLESGEGLYRVLAEKIAELEPDVIVTQAQCEVCAVSYTEVEKAVHDIFGRPCEIVALAGQNLIGVWEDIGRVAEALDAGMKGVEFVRKLGARMGTVSRRARMVAQPMRVACLEWIEPLMAAGNWVPELVEMAGVENLFGVAGKHSPWLDWNDLREADPDVIVVMPCGWSIEQTRENIGPLLALDGWMDLRAVRHDRVFLADGHHYFNRPGPRLAESLEILVELLHPGEFWLGHEGVGWEKL